MPNAIMKEQQISMLRGEMEILMDERQYLLNTTGAAAIFIASLDSNLLPNSVCPAARVLSNSLNNLPEETLQDALDNVRTELIVRA